MFVVPFGKFFEVSRFLTFREIHSVDDSPTFPRGEMFTETAHNAEMYLKEMLGGADGTGNPMAGKVNYGIQFGFRGETDLAKMEVISATLLPPLSSIAGIAKQFDMADPVGVCQSKEQSFDVRDECPTCWRTWLDSPLCAAYIAYVVESGMECAEYDPRTAETEIRTVRPSANDMSSALAMAKMSLDVALSANRSIWTTLVNELEKGERHGMDIYQEQVRKDVHGTKPADKQIALMREFGNASKDGDGTNAVLQKLVESQVEMQKFMMQVLGNRSTGNTAPAPVVPGSNGLDVGSLVTVDGQDGVIVEVKNGGWYGVETEDGIKSVRQQSIERR